MIDFIIPSSLYFGVPVFFLVGMVISLSFITVCAVIYLFDKTFRNAYLSTDFFAPSIDPKASSAKLPDRTSKQSSPLGSGAISIVADAPFPAWQRDAHGKVSWANHQLQDLVNELGASSRPDQIALPSSFILDAEDGNYELERRVSISVGRGSKAEKRWYKICERVTDGGDVVGYAIDASDVVNVESTLSRFVATLTESFAQLSTGLAIFDADRRVTMFNPAIAELMKLDPTWLASKPGFRDFLSKLREAQMVPEQKTSKDWKNFIKNTEKGAVNGTLSEKWVLPSGQTFKITGRPHPHGAIALMIEDITTRISLERKYRSEIEQSRATLDHLSEAICVFDTAGVLVFSNSAADEHWGFKLSESHQRSNIISISSQWSDLCEPDPVWGDLREFVTSLEQRASWTANVRMLDGRLTQAVFAPLPDGSTLTAFAPLPKFPQTPDRANLTMRERDISILELAIEHMQEAVHSVIPKTEENSRLEAVGEEDPNTIADAMKSTNQLLRLRERDAEIDPLITDSLTHDIQGFLDEKSATLSMSCRDLLEDGELTLDIKRLLINVALVTRALVATGENVDLSVAKMEGGVSVSCIFKVAPSLPDTPQVSAGLSYRIMRRYLRENGGEEAICALGDNGLIKISCTMPAKTEAPAETLGATA